MLLHFNICSAGYTVAFLLGLGYPDGLTCAGTIDIDRDKLVNTD